MATALSGPAEVTRFIDDLNNEYEKVHKGFEDNFWATKMALNGSSPEDLTKTKTSYDEFLSNTDKLKAVQKLLQDGDITPEQKKVLQIVEKTYKCYITEDPKAASVKEQLTALETDLETARNQMTLGYTHPSTGEFTKASSVQLRNIMRVDDSEELRKNAYEGLRSIGPFVAEKFLKIVKMRNELARLAGYEDFYDYKVTAAEGFGKRRLFEMMDDLEVKTRPIMEAARKQVAEEKGEHALLPHNISYTLAGDTVKAMDPYFPFEDAVDVWGRTFAALGIKYSGATMRLDLCDREGKYSNGFCHWPQPAWRKSDGTWVPSFANFTSLAIPNAVGSGKTALATLLHEGGHAAHFANIDQRSPFFSQERAPTSVAYAETQSMFLDKYESEAGWLARYALSREGSVIPWDVIEQHLRATHPYEVFMVRAMLAVPYFEKALYELPAEELTVPNLLAMADRIETQIQGGLSPRPLLSVPHILSDEASCYYHGYVLADMAVYQTRAHFKNKYGNIVDNPKIGEELCSVYWRPGNGAPFLDLVEQLTGTPLSAEPWVEVLRKDVNELVVEEKGAYEGGLQEGPSFKAGDEVDLDMRVLLVHGDEVIADSSTSGGFQAACKVFKEWVRKVFPQAAAAT